MEYVAAALLGFAGGTLGGLVGAWRQRGYGNVRVRDGLLVGALSPLGVAAGVVISNAVPERALELLFAALALVFAAQLLRRALATPPHEAPN